MMVARVLEVFYMDETHCPVSFSGGEGRGMEYTDEFSDMQTALTHKAGY